MSLNIVLKGKENISNSWQISIDQIGLWSYNYINRFGRQN